MLLGLCAFTHPPNLIIARKMVRYVDFKDILQSGFKSSKTICLYMIFDWLSVSFRNAVKLRDELMFQYMLSFAQRTALW